MTNWRRMLREHDPGAELLDADTAARIRNTVMRAAKDAAPARAVWSMRVALAAFACVVVVLSVFGTRRPIEVAAPHPPIIGGSERRQIQFATPGGTRIIWELNPNFSLETLP
jgi:hypothetical protein